ncbi:MAG: aspartate kinase [Paludibacteraceae bacterium]|nr:aspartate kinase [Paludibacteraceae bacterium]
MKIYKFGGASVRSAQGIKNLEYILRQETGSLFVVISAMGKTTNAMEMVLDYFVNRQTEQLQNKWQEVKDYHLSVATDLTDDKEWANDVLSPVFQQVEHIFSDVVPMDYDQTYDSLVSYGEILSTTLIASYLKRVGLDACWLDMRRLLRTDSNFREATVHLEASQHTLMEAIQTNKATVYIGQGFIAGNKHGQPTTLGREGSDYTAAVVGNLLNAESVTIWKDVPGILNADPRLFADTVLIPELTYYDAVELAYSGAQIIHPKTIKPLENKSIPLYVKPFENPQAAGSVIKANVSSAIDVPVLIVRKNQVLITIRPLDFSFVLENSLSKLFVLLDKHRLKVSLIQSSAVTISVCVDNVKRLSAALDELSNEFRVSYNEGLELLTVRGVTDVVENKVTAERDVLMKQRTRRTAKYLMKSI